MTALVSGLTTYASTYKDDDLDPLSGDKGALRGHAGYSWLKTHGLHEQFEARIAAHLEQFGRTKVEQILGVIDRLGGHPALLAKVTRAVDENNFWSPNHGFFFEIGDLHNIQQIRFMDVAVGGCEIDVLTGSGHLIDQKYEVNLKKDRRGAVVQPHQLSPRIVRQCTAMQAAVGTTINGIAITGWAIHHAQPIIPSVRATIPTNWAAHFQEGQTARSYR